MDKIALMLQLQADLNEATNGDKWTSGITKNNKIKNDNLNVNIHMIKNTATYNKNKVIHCLVYLLFTFFVPVFSVKRSQIFKNGTYAKTLLNLSLLVTSSSSFSKSSKLKSSCIF